jgi:hypothetical protein
LQKGQDDLEKTTTSEDAMVCFTTSAALAAHVVLDRLRPRLRGVTKPAADWRRTKKKTNDCRNETASNNNGGLPKVSRRENYI